MNSRGGRFNAPDSFETSYTSDSRVTARTEIEALFGDVDRPRSPEFVMTLDVRLSRTLDLTDHTTAALLGTNESELKQPYIEEQMRLGEAPTQRLGRFVMESRRFSAMRVPSAARDGACNVAILPARFAKDESVRFSTQESDGARSESVARVRRA